MYPFQLRAAMGILIGRDVACVAGTLSGKSLAFQAPILLLLGKVGIIICPINALATSMAVALNELKISAVALTDATVSADPGIFVKILKRQYNIVLISPERTLARKGHFWTLVVKGGKQWTCDVGYVVADEGHLILDW